MNQIRAVTSVSRDPELRYTPAGLPILILPTANIARPNGRGVAAYRDVKLFGKRAEKLVTLIKTGDAILVTGRLQHRNYQDKGGNKRQDIDVVAKDIRILNADYFEIGKDKKNQPLLRDGENEVELFGNLVADTKTAPTETLIVTGRIAVNESYLDKNDQWQERTHFIDIEAFDEAALALENAKKGQGFYVRGPLVTNNYKNKQGEWRSNTFVKALTAYQGY